MGHPKVWETGFRALDRPNRHMFYRFFAKEVFLLISNDHIFLSNILAPFSGRGDREYRDFRGRDFHDDRERGGRPQGRFGRDNRENMGNMGNQLPMALAAALNQAGWGMLLQGMQGQGGPGGHGNQAGPNNGATGGTSGNQPPAMGGNTDGLGGGYGSPHGMAWSQGNQAGGGAGDNAAGYFGNQAKGSW